MSTTAATSRGRLANVLPRAMALRLTLALAALAVVVFTSVALLLHRGLQEEIERAREHDLEGKIDVVQHLLDEVRQPQDLQALTHHLNDVLIGDGQMRIWLLAANGRVLYGGLHRPATRPASRLRSGSAGGLGRRLDVVREDGLVMDGRLVLLQPHPVLGARELIVAIDTRAQQALLQRYGVRLATVCGAGVAMTVLLASVIARRSLRPVQRLSQEAAALNPQALSSRLSPVNTAELQTLVKAFNRALDRVEAAYGQLEGFSADVAHELRTPLATMIHGTEVALHRERPAEELRETLQVNLEVLRELSGLVNDMLFLAKADQGQLADRRTTVELREEAQHVADYFEPLLEEHGLCLEIRGSATTVANQALVRRALVNLVGNASRYTERGLAIEVTIEKHESQVRLAVRNPGPAVAPELLPRLFDRFVRGDTAREHSGSHHGLGLAIVRAIAVMHGGRAFARSQGGWTEVGVEWPTTMPTSSDSDSHIYQRPN